MGLENVSFESPLIIWKTLFNSSNIQSPSFPPVCVLPSIFWKLIKSSLCRLLSHHWDHHWRMETARASDLKKIWPPLPSSSYQLSITPEFAVRLCLHSHPLLELLSGISLHTFVCVPRLWLPSVQKWNCLAVSSSVSW